MHSTPILTYFDESQLRYTLGTNTTNTFCAVALVRWLSEVKGGQEVIGSNPGEAKTFSHNFFVSEIESAAYY